MRDHQPALLVRRCQVWTSSVGAFVVLKWRIDDAPCFCITSAIFCQKRLRKMIKTAIDSFFFRFDDLPLETRICKCVLSSRRAYRPYNSPGTSTMQLPIQHSAYAGLSFLYR